MTKKIDIITSMFKAEEYIEFFLISVSQQSIFKDCSLQIVSPQLSEKELKIIKLFKQKYQNIEFINLNNPCSIYQSWNIAIKNTNSQYITNMNCDDSKCSFSLERHLLELESNQDVDLVFSDSFIATEKNIAWGDPRLKYRYKFPQEISIKNLLKYNPPHQSPMWKRSLHEKNGYFDETMFSAADADFWLRCFHNGAKFQKINEILNVYFFNPTGVSTSSEKAEQRIQEEQNYKQKYAKIFSYEEEVNGKLEDIIFNT